jgi:hypothetical protein
MDRNRPDSSRPPTFLAERYWPGIDEAKARALVSSLERAAASMTAEGTPVEHIGSILMPADQVVFSLIAAADEAVARQLNERADVPVDRIAAAIALPAGLGTAGGS